MCVKAGLQGHYTNHSLQSTYATHMYQAGVDEQLIAEVTGHRSLAICSYKRSNEDQQCAASMTISQSCAAEASDTDFQL